MQARRIIMVYVMAICLVWAGVTLPSETAEAAAEIRALELYHVQEQVPRPPVNYLVMGRTTLFALDTTKATATGMELKVEFSADGGASWTHLKDYGGQEWKAIDLPYDYNLTSVHFRIHAKFDPKVGADSRDTKVFGPYKVYHAYGPSEAAYTANNDGSISITFQDNSTMEDHYEIVRRGDGQEKRFKAQSVMADRGKVHFKDTTANSLKSTKYLYQIQPVFESIPLPLEIQPPGTSVLAETKASLLGYLQLNDYSRIDLNTEQKWSHYLSTTLPDTSEDRPPLEVIWVPFEFPNPDAEAPPAAEMTNEETAAVEQELAELEQLLELTAAGASSWAREDIQTAALLGLATGDVLSDYQLPISRQHFSGLAVKLMEKLTGQAAVPANNPFKDTQNPDILKAYALNVIQGRTADTFDPYANVSRQEISLMLWRITHLAGLYGELTVDAEATTFADRQQVAPWAGDAVDYISSVGLVKGKGKGLFDPQGSTTREEAIVLMKRMYDAAMAEK
ncbi:hypothetical protein PA598K_06018 [Paenibacillus sp. 598K]|uniref:S-layer homology domain-containing protein n=1 Tax=Paenibacillus sp. 598K TaxID=1117987 RepID=UPI000FF95A90|nr:S-layer homology domain-containing protein [Paenibacillus sp. 598K]GBF77466.1 hypothetical protein PA598K_06018 [Paenibacillus sp. 598K]